jgi:hypothetical protein
MRLTDLRSNWGVLRQLLLRPVPGRLGDLQLAGHLFHRLTRPEQLLALLQQPDDLLGGVVTSLHRVRPFLPTIVGSGSHNRWINPRGQGRFPELNRHYPTAARNHV